MFATVVSVIMGVGLCIIVPLVPGLEPSIVFSKNVFELFFGLSIFLSLFPWLSMLYLSQGAEGFPVTMAALRSNLGDKKPIGYSLGILVVAFLGMALTAQSYYPPTWSLAGSLIGAGLILDLLRMSYCRVQYRRTPEGIAEWFVEVMKKAVRKQDPRWHTISFEIPISLMVVYMKAGAYGSLRLFCQRIVEIADLWLGSIARLRLFRIPSEFEESLLDRYMQAEAMTSKRIAWIVQEACHIGSLTGLEETTRLAGKLAMTFHNHHESLGSLILITLAQASQRGCGNMTMWDLEMEVVSTLSEVAKSLIDRSVDRNTSDAASILKVFTILESKVKEIFHREKTMNPALLMQPFAEIGQMLAGERYRSFPDRDEVLADLRRILAQFSALEGVTSRLAGGGGEDTDTKASFREDLPFAAPRKKEEQPS
jgi:hypothetical protein